jgi:hypothetical protein
MKKSYVQVVPTYRDATEIRISSAEMPDTLAKLASEIASRFALIAAIPEGEDSAGRQKLRLPTATELAARSCDIAAALWAEFEERDWLLDLPAPVLPTERE